MSDTLTTEQVLEGIQAVMLGAVNADSDRGHVGDVVQLADLVGWRLMVAPKLILPEVSDDATEDEIVVYTTLVHEDNPHDKTLGSTELIRAINAFRVMWHAAYKLVKQEHRVGTAFENKYFKCIPDREHLRGIQCHGYDNPSPAIRTRVGAAWLVHYRNPLTLN